MVSQIELKQQVARAAIEFILPILRPDDVLGVGTGSTVDCFIDALAPYKDRFRAAVSSSDRSTEKLKAIGVEVMDLNDVATMPVYVDGADEIDGGFNMIKGGGGALTREKIIASVSERYVCIVDESKFVQQLGAFPLPVEVIPMARNSVARRLEALGGQPSLRTGFITDNGGEILDVAGLDIRDPAQLEATINNIPGVISCGLFAQAGADVLLMATPNGVQQRRADHS